MDGRRTLSVEWTFVQDSLLSRTQASVSTVISKTGTLVDLVVLNGFPEAEYCLLSVCRVGSDSGAMWMTSSRRKWDIKIMARCAINEPDCGLLSKFLSLLLRRCTNGEREREFAAIKRKLWCSKRFVSVRREETIRNIISKKKLFKLFRIMKLLVYWLLYWSLIICFELSQQLSRLWQVLHFEHLNILRFWILHAFRAFFL